MKHLHFGVVAADDSYRSDEAFEEARQPVGLPPGFITDGDSFFNWGNEPGTDDDNGRMSLHVIFPYEGDERPDVRELRIDLATWLATGVRLVDYVIESNADDWAANQKIWTLDNIWSR